MSETPTPCRRRWSRRLDRAFTGSLSKRRLRALRAHVGSCDRCREVYDRLGEAERAMYGSAFPGPAVERVQTLALEPATRDGRRLWAPAGALVAAAAAALLWVVVEPRPSPPEEFRARGTDQMWDELVPGEREPGVRLFCVDVADGSSAVTDEVHMAVGAFPPPTLRCTLDAELQIAYSTSSLPGLTMMVFANGPSGTTHWYAPTQPGASSVPLATDVIDEPLAWSTRLGVEHEPGRYEVVTRFFLGPVPASTDAADPIAELRANLAIEASEEAVP